VSRELCEKDIAELCAALGAEPADDAKALDEDVSRAFCRLNTLSRSLAAIETLDHLERWMKMRPDVSAVAMVRILRAAMFEAVNDLRASRAHRNQGR
jgi:hypothetical protein